MSKKLFSNKDIELLSKNKYVKNVNEKAITYTDEFKYYLLLRMKKVNSQEIYLQKVSLILM